MLQKYIQYIESQNIFIVKRYITYLNQVAKYITSFNTTVNGKSSIFFLHLVNIWAQKDEITVFKS